MSRTATLLLTCKNMRCMWSAPEPGLSTIPHIDFTHDSYPEGIFGHYNRPVGVHLALDDQSLTEESSSYGVRGLGRSIGTLVSHWYLGELQVAN